jgi:glycosyltransferase involved in cell wall biosynthesis
MNQQPSLSIGVIIPVLNEESTLSLVIDAIPKWVDRIVVVDNASTDNSAEVAYAAGAEVIFEQQRGYGAACSAGVRHISSSGETPGIVVFVDGDFADDPKVMDRLIAPIEEDIADFVIGSRQKGAREKGALSIPQRFGNLLSCALMQKLYGVTYTDLGPFRAIRLSALSALNMDDLGFGWTVQMQVRAAKAGLRIAEVPVPYRNRRGGKSKVSGTVRGVVGAGSVILYTIFKESRFSIRKPLSWF